LRKLVAVNLSLVLIFSLTACASESASTALNADVILLDISGSSTDSEGTYNQENHSPSSLSERRRQLEVKIKDAINSNTTVYFGFVRLGYGVTDIATLVPPRLILEINNVLTKDLKNGKLREEARDGISAAWESAINQEARKPDSCTTDSVEKLILEKSGGFITSANAKRIAGQLCSGARNAIYQFDQLKGEQENIGSDVQAAVDRSLQKLASDERRLINSDGVAVALIPRLIVVSDLIQVTGGKSKTKEVSATSDPKQACELAKEESKNFKLNSPTGISLISDGFAGTKKEVNSSDRDKLRRYWECWFNTRNVEDIEIGAKGIDLGAL
jgi:hypothetical protein